MNLILSIIIILMGIQNEPYQEELKLADDRIVSFRVADIGDYEDQYEKLGWLEDHDLTEYDHTPVYRNKDNQILEAVASQGVCFLFESEVSYRLYDDKVIVLSDEKQLFPFALVERSDFEYLEGKYELKLLEELSKAPSEFYEVSDGRIMYVDEHWKEGMIYRNMDEYRRIRQIEGPGPMIMIPGLTSPGQGEAQGAD